MEKRKLQSINQKNNRKEKNLFDTNNNQFKDGEAKQQDEFNNN